MTENHGYQTPDRGEPNWDEPLNENFERIDVDVEIRDTSESRDTYEPADGALFVELDTGIAYLGDGDSWSPALAMGYYDANGNVRAEALQDALPTSVVSGGSDGEGSLGSTVGRGARSEHPGAIVFGDSTGKRIYSQQPDEVRLQMPIYAPSFNSTSAAAAKTAIAPVDPEAVLDGVESLEVCEWEFTETDDGRHIGPMAEAFHDAFGLGPSDGAIASVDADGVAFAAIQGLASRQHREIATLQRALDDRDERIDVLEAELTVLRGQIDRLESTVGAIERQERSEADD